MPEQFAARWLTLREPADHAARDDTLLSALIDALPRDRTIRISDLGAGAGSNLRYLGPRLPQAQEWTLIDHDRELLDQAVAMAHPADDDRAAARVQARAQTADLGGFPDCLDTPPDLLTASALLDLVSEDWLRRVVDTCCRRCLPALFALSVDGRLAFSPTLEGDAGRGRGPCPPARCQGHGAGTGPGCPRRCGAVIPRARRRRPLPAQ